MDRNKSVFSVNQDIIAPLNQNNPLMWFWRARNIKDFILNKKKIAFSKKTFNLISFKTVIYPIPQHPIINGQISSCRYYPSPSTSSLLHETTSTSTPWVKVGEISLFIRSLSFILSEHLSANINTIPSNSGRTSLYLCRCRGWNTRRPQSPESWSVYVWRYLNDLFILQQPFPFSSVCFCPEKNTLMFFGSWTQAMSTCPVFAT